MLHASNIAYQVFIYFTVEKKYCNKQYLMYILTYINVFSVYIKFGTNNKWGVR